jgi:hypothetical protein
LEEHQRDVVFQQQHAGVIAASWVDTLLIDVGGPPLDADFTLATRYQFDGVVRVDFSIRAPAGVTRETLAFIHVRAGKDLPPGSVANLQSLTFTYETDQFQRVVSASQGAGDLIEVDTGVRDPGVTIGTIPDTWERRDVRAEMIYAVQGLIEHLNEHVDYYTKFKLWRMDHDRLWMLIDGFYVPGTNQISIASVVERDPIAIVGNALVFRVSAGSCLGIGDIKTPADLFNHYVSLASPSEPMLISLPTDGHHAQTIMDECGALEEHFGNTDWVLNDPDPTLGEIAPELLASRLTEPQPTQPTQLPQTIINLQNAPEAPAPSGLAGALAAVTTPNAFRDMAGLAATQANTGGGGGGGAPPMSPFPSRFVPLSRATLSRLDKINAAFDGAVNDSLIDPGSANMQDLHDLPLAIVALDDNGARPLTGQHHSEMYYSGSLLKMAALYAAYQLRVVANDLAATLDMAVINTPAKLFQKIRDAFDPQIENVVQLINDKKPPIKRELKIPKYDVVFQAAQSGGRWVLDFNALNTITSAEGHVDSFAGHLRSMIVGSHNDAAGVCIRALGYSWINGVLQAAGFLDLSLTGREGIWLARDYERSPTVEV